jgi:FG-GAP-like repeat/FlgD Ig-like domain
MIDQPLGDNGEKPVVLRRLRTAYALAASAALIPVLAGAPAFALPGGAQPVVAQGSKPPSEVAFFPAATQSAHPLDAVLAAGVSGFLHEHDAKTEPLWTRYDTGATTVAHDLNGVGGLRYAGGDTVYTSSQVPSHPAPGQISLFDMATGAWQQWPVPSGAHFLAVYGTSTMLVSAVQDGVNVLQLVTFSADGTATGTRTVTGLAAGASLPAALAVITNGSAAVITYRTAAAGTTYALLDIASAAATTITSTTGSFTFVASGDRVASYTPGSSTVHVYSVSGLVSGTDPNSHDVALPGTGYRVVLVGDHLIANAGGGPEGPALDVPIAGGASTQLLPLVGNSGSTLAQGPGGTALVAGGSGIADWAVHRFTAGASGSLTDQVVYQQADPLTNAGLSFSHGLLRQVRSGLLQIGLSYEVQSHAIAPDSADTTPDQRTILYPTADSCADGVRCVRLADSETHGMVYLATSATAGTVEVHTDNGTSPLTIPVPASGGRLVDASPSYAVVNAASDNTQYIVRLDAAVAYAAGPITAAALWYQTLWTASGTPGQLQAAGLEYPYPTRTVSTGANCVPTEIQATGRWLYWSCGIGQPAGVYNLSADGPLSLPTITGPAMLGDGFLVWHDSAAGALEMVDFHDRRPTPGDVTVVPGSAGSSSATAVKLTNLAAGPVTDDRGITWTVDKYGSDVAYVATDQSIHVLDTGVPPSPAVVVQVVGETRASPLADSPRFNPVIQLDRPVSAWTLTITRDIGGQQVFTTSGGAARSSVQVSWDGRMPDGAPAMDGAYTWHLSVTAAGGNQVIAGTGAASVICGDHSPHGYNCDNSVAILTVKASGEAYWYVQNVDQVLQQWGSERWPLGSSGSGNFDALVPFGDFDGDHWSDLLARDGNGVLHAYQGNGSVAFGPAQTAQVTIGTGWQGYTLVSTGDVNGDGKDDLLARDPSGSLWLYPNTGGSLGSRVLVGGGWNIYTRLIGANDLNGDGIGDLLGIDASGVMWRYYGTGTGGYAPRVMVGSGWGIYNAVIGVGDLNLDGNADLLTRDSAGNLWQYLGDGAGGFLPRTQHGYGFQVYAQIF